MQAPSWKFLLPALVLSFAASASAQKQDYWIEVRSPHFTVVSNAGEKQARRTAEQFEQFRAVFQSAFPKARVDSGIPLIIFAVKDEKSLKTLLPEDWEQKGHTHPAGVFQPGLERNYAALRLDTEDEYPFHVIYHEYVHELNHLNFTVLPVWLNEGLAELFGYAVLGDKESLLGKVTEYQLEVLKTQKLLPIEVMLSVDHNSPYYNEENKSTIFYAQSWVMAHWLLLGDRAANFQKMVTYLEAIDKGMPVKDAAQHAFGDLKTLERTLEGYARQRNFYVIRVKAPAEIDAKSFAARPLAPAESLAVRGDFYLYTNRPVEARATLEQALQADPSNAAANESMGFLQYRQKNYEEATKYFSSAVKLDSRSFLAHYYFAMLAKQGQSAGASLDEAEAHLRKAVELNPNFAPAYMSLAGLLMRREGKLEEALALAVKAAEMEPGSITYKVNVANVLTRLGRTDEAIAICERLLQVAATEAERQMAFAALSNAQQYKSYLAERKRIEEERAAYEREMVARRKAYEEDRKRQEEEAKSLDEAAKKAPPKGGSKAAAKSGKRPVSSSASGGPNASLEGTIVDVACAPPAVMVITLEIGDNKYRFRAENYFKVDVLSTGWTAAPNFQPCVDLPKRRHARLEFVPTPGQEFFGILRVIEIH